MVWHCVRRALLTSAFLAAAAVPARADHECAAPAAPCTRTICVRECVPETYTTTRTVYKTEWKEEKYTAYRCETVPETRTRTYTVCKQVQETVTETRNVCVLTPTVEERTVMETHVTCKPVTRMVSRCVDRGHYECREVPCQPSWRERLKKLCHRKSCCDDCCPPPTKVVKVWVPCKVWEQVPCTTIERVCESRPVKVKVTMCKPVMQQQQVQVVRCRLVPEQKTETCQVFVTKRVPYEAVRKVAVCVPTQETVTCTRMVWKTVQKQVPAETCCETTCCSSGGHAKRGLFARRHHCCD